MTNNHASGKYDLGLDCLVLECDAVQNDEIKCRGYCTSVMVKKTLNYIACAQICINRELCRHYIWHRYTNKAFECWVVESEEEGLESVSRHYNHNAISGTCRKGIKREREREREREFTT